MRGSDAVKSAPAYAVVWSDESGSTGVGRLELRRAAVLLVATCEGAHVTRELPYGEIRAVRVGRAAADRLQGQPTVVIELGGGGTIRLGSVGEAGIVQELVDRLASLALGDGEPTRLAVVLPLRPGTRAQALALVAAGPPFAPAAAGLCRHDVFVGDGSAVFVFVFAAPASAALERVVGAAEALVAAAGWHELAAGPPEVAEAAFSWAADPEPRPLERIGLGC